MEKNLGELLNISLIIKDKIHKNTVWKATDCDDLAPHFSMQERNVETTNSNTVLGLEIETRDSTEKNAGSNEESENEQPLLRGTNSLNSDVENTGDVLNTTNEI